MTYDLTRLGWNSFQQLCLTIVREVLGQTVQSFLDSFDGGRDGAFTGSWQRTGQENFDGQFVFQCKFTSRPNHTLRTTDVSEELAKVEKLVKQGRCDIYVLMTNAGLSGKGDEAIARLFEDVGAKHVLLLGSTWISEQIRESKRLRMLIPRLYGLGDLSQILDERAYSQARAILESMREDLAKVVVTSTYQEAVAALDKHGFVLLLGEPAAGKTTIASMLAMAALDQWGASLLKLDDPATVIERWNPDEPSQFFWVDDAFGVTQYEPFLAHGWNRIYPQVKAMLRKGAKVVMTSRDYIYNRARSDLKESAFPLLKESQVVVDVHGLSLEEKRRILYNHIKLGRQPTSFRTAVKPYLETVAAHARFIPEVARRMADPLFTEGLSLTAYGIERFVDKREHFLQEVLQSLDDNNRAALALIYMRKGHLESPFDLHESEQQALARLGGNLSGCLRALESLDGSLVVHSRTEQGFAWRFKHPTIGDSYAAILASSPELLSIFIQGSAPDELIAQVSCGDVGLEMAVVLPKSLFPAVLRKLGELMESRGHKSRPLSWWDTKSALHRFLTRRCSREFLELYIQQSPKILDEVSHPGLMLDAVSEVPLALRLHELGLLPEDKRRTFVEVISAYAVSGEDMSVLDDDDMRRVFSEDETSQLQDDVSRFLIPRLDDVRMDWQHNYYSDVSPEEYMQPLLESFGTLKSQFASDAGIVSVVEREERRVIEWITEKATDEDDAPRRAARTLGKVVAEDGSGQNRSIFDDVDS